MPLTTPSITPVKVGPNGTGRIADIAASAAQAAQVGGDAFKVQGKECLVVINGDASPHTVTISSVADNFGTVNTANDIVQVVAAGKHCIIGPLDATKYADGNGLAQITYSAVVSVTIGLLTFSTTS